MIKAFAFDVDGVATEGGVFCDLEGQLFRTYDAKDGFALRMASMHGYHLAVITGGRSESIRKRFRSCGILPEDVYLGSRDKLSDFHRFIRKYGLDASEVMFFGDDVPDIPVMKASGVGVAPSDAVPDVLAIADVVSAFPGGKGCLRDAIEREMKAQGTWDLDVETYKKTF